MEPLVEIFDRMENFGMRQVRIVERRHLHAVLIDKFGVGLVKSAFLERLIEQECSGIRRYVSVCAFLRG
jgi:hypothetical protein